ncbi:glycosyltransferase family 4 protein [Sneathiella aquimaris]|uniref:glycosyltransferase family 4 protein n=1 Tax=Sneathiella aquimaris TaxID=2599305 RepID=UPI00146A9B1C|nr:glycosyltransferase family 4 protein [Sneathiella aquimaris]
MKLGFYAPMKSPNHPVPSGDRRVARLLMKALREAGFEVDLYSEFRSFDKNGDKSCQEEVRLAGLAEAERIISVLENTEPAARPQAWFTYHVYHKAPDWIGPKVSGHFGIPYFVAEASHAPKQKEGPWAMGYEAAEKAIKQASRVFHMTRLDGACLKPLLDRQDALVYLPPFLDEQPAALAEKDVERLLENAGWDCQKSLLLTVAMMRSGDKLQSYRQLAEACRFLGGDDWQLAVVGDGPQKDLIRSFFEPAKDRLLFLGALEAPALFGLYKKADVYVWPAHGEAYGMTFLEAASCGLPAVAGDIRGVPDVVLSGKTGLLCPAGDMPAFAAAIRKLLDEPHLRAQLGQNAANFARDKRGLEAASSMLKQQLGEVLS